MIPCYQMFLLVLKGLAHAQQRYYSAIFAVRVRHPSLFRDRLMFPIVLRSGRKVQGGFEPQCIRWQCDTYGAGTLPSA